LRKLTKYKILIIILLSISTQALFAQKSKEKKDSNTKWFIGVNGGITTFWGDIKFNSFWPSTKMQELQAGSGIVFGRTFSPALKLNSEISFISLKGKQEVLADTIGFKTQVLSFAIKGAINPIALLTKKETRLSFYIESGAGIMGWKNLTQNYSNGDTLSNLGWTNSNKEFGFYIPAGIKIEYQITPTISTYFNSNYNLVFSDLIDGISSGNYDSYSFTTIGINYHLGKQKTTPKLLPYNFFDLAYDSLANQPITKKKKPKKEETNKEAENPFSIVCKVPETAPHTGFDIQIDISKIGISARGFFRVICPSGFIPQAATNKDVCFTKLGYHYEYDFILPINQDSTTIPIHIKLSEIEKGTYPILIEGEIMNKKGDEFPIKFATYTEIMSEESWYKGLSIKEQQKFNAKKLKEKQFKTTSPESEKTINQKEEPQQTLTKKIEKQIDSTTALYRIQIMASRNKFGDLESFKIKHKIKDKIFISQADGWYRYNLYATNNIEEAHRLCAKVRKENNIPQAFVTYYKNGKRVILPSSQSSKISSQKKPKSTVSNTTNNINQAVKKDANSNGKILYRIEIALSYNQPIPLYLLKNKAGEETINEFRDDKDYYYSIGKFENLEVARAFLYYVKTELKFETAKITQYQKDKRIKVIF